jgi:hypothetical protein
LTSYYSQERALSPDVLSKLSPVFKRAIERRVLIQGDAMGAPLASMTRWELCEIWKAFDSTGNNLFAAGLYFPSMSYTGGGVTDAEMEELCGPKGVTQIDDVATLGPDSGPEPVLVPPPAEEAPPPTQEALVPEAPLSPQVPVLVGVEVPRESTGELEDDVVVKPAIPVQPEPDQSGWMRKSLTDAWAIGVACAVAFLIIVSTLWCLVGRWNEARRQERSSTARRALKQSSTLPMGKSASAGKSATAGKARTNSGGRLPVTASSVARTTSGGRHPVTASFVARTTSGGRLPVTASSAAPVRR